MRVLFWVSLAGIFYAYAGYGVILAVRQRMRPRPIVREDIFPTVSVLIAARNEEDRLPGKLANLAALDYPRDRIEMLIVSDHSTDRTAEILLGARPAITPLILTDTDGPAGKASALNRAVRQATGEILVFLDARQMVDGTAVRELVSCFADVEVGAVSGELLLESVSGSREGLGIYWRIEKAVRKLESASGSTVGVTGAIYAIRRELYRDIPEGTILDDVYVPMHVARLGKRVLFLPSAIARDRLFVERGKEFSRKVRTLTGNYQLLRLAPWMLSLANPLLFRFVSHKLARLAVPFFMVLLLVSSWAAVGWLFHAIFYAQIGLYLLAALGLLLPRTQRFQPVGIAQTFVMLNAAAAVAFYNFVAGRNKVWIR